MLIYVVYTTNQTFYSGILGRNLHVKKHRSDHSDGIAEVCFVLAVRAAVYRTLSTMSVDVHFVMVTVFVIWCVYMV